ncbi:MAG: hypothetical protein ACRC7N_13360 [Clostridium sp.]
MNNTNENLKNLYIRLEDYTKEVHLDSLKKGAVISRYLFTDILSDEKDIYLYHIDSTGVKHEYLIYKKFKCSNIQKLKLRINSIDSSGNFILECVEYTD